MTLEVALDARVVVALVSRHLGHTFRTKPTRNTNKTTRPLPSAARVETRWVGQ